MKAYKKYFLLIAILFTVTACSQAPAKGPQETAEQHAEIQAKNWYDGFLFNDQSYVFEFIRALGSAYYQGADIGECVATAREIKDGDDESWYREWKKTADRIYLLADKWEKQGYTVSARKAYFRASGYYRSASFYMDSPENRPRAMEMWAKSKESFMKAIASLPYVEPVKIPYENTTLPGYFIKASNASSPAPLLIVNTGFDGTKEELYFEVGLAAKERGYNCLVFDGPGQGEALRTQGLYFRYDWEKVVTPAVDYALTRSDVDKDNIALMGISMGGYLAPRAVCFEHRIKACVANGGVYDFSAASYKSTPPDVLKLIETDPAKYDKLIEENMKVNPSARWAINNGIWTFGVKSPAEYMKEVKKYTLEGIAGKIKCRTLVIDSEEDMFLKGQPQALYDALDCPKDFITFTADEAAQAHCQMGASAISNEIIFNWLDSVLKRQ